MFKGVMLGLIGVGNMGEILIKGLTQSKILSPAQILACDKDRKRLTYITNQYGVEVFSNTLEVAKKADMLLIAVKPQNLNEVLDEIRDEIAIGKLIMSIAAGVSINHISSRLIQPYPIVRIMPNTPSLVFEGMSAICPGEGVSEDALKVVVKLFDSIGRTIIIEDESLMDAVTGLSGSGPAFVFLFLEALTDGGVKMGLKRDVARLLAAQTVLGSARLAMETGRHFGELKDMVTSPAGTTIAGLSHLERKGLRGIVMDAVEKAALRAKELAKKEGE